MITAKIFQTCLNESERKWRYQMREKYIVPKYLLLCFLLVVKKIIIYKLKVAMHDLLICIKQFWANVLYVNRV